MCAARNAAARCGPDCPRVSPRGAFGPRLQAAVATLAMRNRISRRDTVELMGDLFGAHLATGSVDAILWRTAAALYRLYEKLLHRTPGLPVRQWR